jgi:hypothetical protein
MRRQRLALGISAATFDRRCRREGWPRLHPGVWLLPGADPTDFRLHVSAALLTAGDDALATGWTGLHLHGVIVRPPPIVSLVVPWASGRRRLHAVRTMRSRTLLDEDRGERSRLAVASPERCFLDAGRTDSRERLRTMLIDARQRRVVEPLAVATRALVHPRIPGSSQLVSAARDVDGRVVDSVLSDVVHRRLLLAGLAPDPRPVTVTTPSGRVLHPTSRSRGPGSASSATPWASMALSVGSTSTTAKTRATGRRCGTAFASAGTASTPTGQGSSTTSRPRWTPGVADRPHM